jgi:hypothetical protein
MYLYIECLHFLCRILDGILPIAFFLISCTLLAISRRQIQSRRPVDENDCLRLPTAKTVSVFRRSLVLLIVTLLEISSWAFLFAWRLESAILERSKMPPTSSSNSKIPPLYQVIDPSLAFIPRVSSLKVLITICLLTASLIDLHTNTRHQIIHYASKSNRSIQIHQIHLSLSNLLLSRLFISYYSSL